MSTIDAHLHVFEKVSAEFPREANEICPADRAEPVEKLLEQMETHGVDQAVLVQIGGTALEHHAYLQHCLKEYEGRFRGIGLIPPESDSPEDHMDRLAEGGGIIGFRMSNMGGPADPLAPMDIRTFGSYPIWKHAAEKDYVLWLYPRAKDAHLVPWLVDAFPQVRVVFNHLMVCPGEGTVSLDKWGRPHIDTSMPPMTHWSTLVALHTYENVYILCSGQYAFSKEAYPYKDLGGWHRGLVSRFGANRMMWATDFPWILEEPGYGPLTKIVDELLPDLTEKERADIMGETAKRYLRFPG
ncbi:MAG: amidohydrolase family protein [bacterium]|nr:amidohydrolase family protein [bacterium]